MTDKEIKTNLDFLIKECNRLEDENAKLKEDYIKLNQQKDLDNVRWQKRCTDLHIEDKAKADKYWLVLQEIKEIAEDFIKGVSDEAVHYYPMYTVHTQILNLINESEG